jgi:hypothetical protein
MPKTEIGATEVISSVFSGAGVAFELNGDPIPNMGKYQAWGMIAWSTEDKCYKSLWLDNMGAAQIVDGYYRDGALIMMSAAPMMGEPVANRSVLKFGADGSYASIEEHRMVGDHAPMHSFSAKYTKQ